MSATNAALAGALNFPQPARFLVPGAVGVFERSLFLDRVGPGDSEVDLSVSSLDVHLGTRYLETVVNLEEGSP